MTLDHRTIRTGFSRFATGVTVVTCRNDDGETHGTTVNAFTAVSLDPPLCEVTLTRESQACGFLEDRPFAINVLAVDQLDTAWTRPARQRRDHRPHRMEGVLSHGVVNVPPGTALPPDGNPLGTPGGRLAELIVASRAVPASGQDGPAVTTRSEHQ